jgi:TonB family protein
MKLHTTRYSGLALTLLVAAAARAQDSAVARACDRPSNAKVQAAFYGQLVTIPQADMAALGPEYLQGVMEAVRQSWRPGPLALAVYAPNNKRATLTATTTVAFTLTKEGAVQDLGLLASSLSPEFDRAVYFAVQRADSAKLIVALPEPAPSRVKFYFTVFISDYPDTARHRRVRPGLVTPLLTTALPAWDGDVKMPAPIGGSLPKYPEIAVEHHIEDSLLVRYVIDEQGKVVPETIFFENGTYQDFVQSVRNWLPRAKYRPGHIGTCAVKVLAEQPFKYSMPTTH